MLDRNSALKSKLQLSGLLGLCKWGANSLCWTICLSSKGKPSRYRRHQVCASQQILWCDSINCPYPFYSSTTRWRAQQGPTLRMPKRDPKCLAALKTVRKSAETPLSATLPALPKRDALMLLLSGSASSTKIVWILFPLEEYRWIRYVMWLIILHHHYAVDNLLGYLQQTGLGYF